jgi:Protein of unknown function (DUF4079)
MLVSLALAAAALQSGLRMRRARLRAGPRRAGERQRHLRLAKTAVAMVMVGFAAGLGSAVWLRGFEPLASLHGWLALGAAALFAATAWLGHRLEHGALEWRELHARLAIAALLAAAAALGTGFVLLP